MSSLTRSWRRGEKPYRSRPGCQRLLGHRFSLCRGHLPPPAHDPGHRAADTRIRVLVAMGDDDPCGRRRRSAPRQLIEMEKVAKVSVAVRTHHPKYDELLELADASHGTIEVLTENKELMTRLVRVHFALTSGDMWSPELCVVGIPQLILSQTTRHAMSGKKMDEEGVATFLGNSAEVSASSS